MVFIKGWYIGMRTFFRVLKRVGKVAYKLKLKLIKFSMSACSNHSTKIGIILLEASHKKLLQE